MKAILGRLWRNALAGAIAYTISALTSEPKLLLLAPVINAGFKGLRDRYPNFWLWKII